MLLRFGVANFRSIREYQELSLVASSLKDEPDYLLPVPGGRERALPVAAIYGANASGKSNVLQAFDYLRTFVLTSQTQGSATGGVLRQPFLLDPVCRQEPSRYDCDVVVEGVRYHFGFVTDSERVMEEWLYAYPTGSRQVWYHRKQSDTPSFYFGKSLKGKNRTIETLTRSNSLFLSAAAQNNHEQLSPIFGYFQSKCAMIEEARELRLIANGGILKRDVNRLGNVIRFLQHAETGIVGVWLKPQSMPAEVSSLLSEIDTVISNHFPGGVDFHPEAASDRLELLHQGTGGPAVPMDLSTESKGTRALLKLLMPVFEALEDGKTLLIDELNTSIHTLLSLRLLQLFTSSGSNSKGAQLIFTTHDTNLLCGQVLRRDEIWFTEKDAKGATAVYPLTDIRTRNTDNLEKGYLQGRFGGIPFLGPIEALFKDQGYAS